MTLMQRKTSLQPQSTRVRTAISNLETCTWHWVCTYPLWMITRFACREDRNEHRLSRFCRGCDIKAFLMIRDEWVPLTRPDTTTDDLADKKHSSKPTGYKMQEYLLPFDWKRYNWSIICKKCGGCFSSEEEMKIHEHTRTFYFQRGFYPRPIFRRITPNLDPVVPSRCLHCNRVFSTGWVYEDVSKYSDD